jgi:ABC-type multidrug transport system fused ATPase/permease subunit
MVNLLKRLWLHITKKRKIQLLSLFLFIILSALSEVISLTAMIPFLGVLSDPNYILKYKTSNFIFEFVYNFSKNNLLFYVTLIFVSAVLISGILRITLIWIQNRLSFSLGGDFTYKIFKNILYQPYNKHISRNSSEVISGLSKANNLVGTILLPIITIISSSFILMMILITLFTINIQAALFSFTSFGLIYILIAQLTKKRLLLYSNQNSTESTNLVKTIQEGLGGIRDILIDSTQSIFLDIFSTSDTKVRRSQANISIIGGIPRYIIETFGMIIISIYAFNLTNDKSNFSNSITTIGVLALGAQRMMPILQQLFQSWTTIRGSLKSFNDALDLLDENFDESNFINSNTQRIFFNSSIVFNNVSFRYNDTSPFILDKINFEISKGDIIGIVGETGSGKSTLIDLILALQLPTEGEILIDKVKLKLGNRKSWQSKLGHVSQFIFLSDKTITENIAFGVSLNKIDFKKITFAAENAKISNTINSLEKKYNTIIGERGVSLSGGERQRIGIARALYKNSELIILDEATSALDHNTEKEVIDSIQNLGSNLTIIMIAHRLSTLNKCDKIFEIKNGKIFEINKSQLNIKKNE